MGGGGTCFRTLGDELPSKEQTDKELLVEEGEQKGVERGDTNSKAGHR